MFECHCYHTHLKPPPRCPTSPQSSTNPNPPLHQTSQLSKQHSRTLPLSLAIMSLVRRDDLLPPAIIDNSSDKKPNRVPTGVASEVIISEHSFRSGHRAFQQQHLLSSEPPAKKRKREDRGDASVVYGASAYKGPWARYEEHRPDVSGSEESGSEVEVEYEEDELEAQPAAPTSKAGTNYGETSDEKETSEFHGSEEHDYQGRTYMHVPQDLDIDLRRPLPYEERKNYVPKKLMHTWKSHTKPITATRFFPDSGHLLLSASADTKIKIWDVYHSRELLRTYSGHSKAVTDIDFVPDGRTFLSGSYDRSMKQWDTETGQCVARFSTGATPHCLRWNPSMPHEFLAGMSDKKIVQFDTRAEGRKPVQEYDHHLGPVNTITFCDEDRRFITTSDDKSLRAWGECMNAMKELRKWLLTVVQNTRYLCRSSSLLSHTCSRWYAQRHIRAASTSPSRAQITRSSSTRATASSGRTAKYVFHHPALLPILLHANNITEILPRPQHLRLRH